MCSLTLPSALRSLTTPSPRHLKRSFTGLASTYDGDENRFFSFPFLFLEISKASRVYCYYMHCPALPSVSPVLWSSSHAYETIPYDCPRVFLSFLFSV